MPQSTAPPLPEWELVLSSAARLQSIIPGAVLVGGTASAIHAHHRLSRDTDHVLVDLRSRFDEVPAQLESVAGWKTVQRPVQILGSLDGIETGVRQLTAKAAEALGVTQPRISDLMRRKIALFSLDTLVEMAAAAGLQVKIRVTKAV